MTYPFAEPVVILSRTVSGTDDYGDDIQETIAMTVQGVFAPAPGSESTNGQDQVTTQPQVYLPYGTDVTFASAIQINGLEYEVDGDPMPWRSPFTGNAFGVAVPLKRVTG